ANPDGTLSRRAQALDCIFSSLSGEGRLPSQPRSTAIPPDRGADEGSEAEAEPPVIHGPADLRAANEWFRRERQRLQQYTQNQLARIQQERQTLLGQNYMHEQALIVRAQELSRQEQLVAQQSHGLQQRAADLARREQALANQLARWYADRQEPAE